MSTLFKYGAAEAAQEPYHYTMCGLDDVYLLNGVTFENTPYGEGVTIQNVDGLHKAIGKYLVTEKKALNGKEIRFLRHEMDLTQAELGDRLRVADQTIARWEKDEFPIRAPEEMLLRLAYLLDGRCQLQYDKLADALRKIDESRPHERQLFVPTRDGWEPAAKAA